MSQRYPKARTIQQVMHDSPSLAQLTSRLQASQRCMQAILPLIPLPMRKAVHPGPIDQTGPDNTVHPHKKLQMSGEPTPAKASTVPLAPLSLTTQTYWTILADNAAVAAKLRQMKPLMLQYLEKNNLPIQDIHIQIIPPGTGY